jgi:hypothetical protein
MRAGYDRVTSDTRKPPIPDLPVNEADARTESERQASSALLVMGAVFGFLLLLAVAEGLYASLTGYLG